MSSVKTIQNKKVTKELLEQAQEAQAFTRKFLPGLGKEPTKEELVSTINLQSWCINILIRQQGNFTNVEDQILEKIENFEEQKEIDKVLKKRNRNR